MLKVNPRNLPLEIQHLLAMFGSTVLVPMITGMSPSVALFSAGVGTLIFHLCTKFIVPVFQGSSFAFIPALTTILGSVSPETGTLMNPSNISKAQCGVIAAGVVYVVLSLIVKLVGPDRIRKIFPAIVTGPVIIIIGLSLTGVGIKDSFGFQNPVFDSAAVKNILIALFTFIIVIVSTNSMNKRLRMVPILVGLLCGYALCVLLDCFGWFQMDYRPIAAASWINVPFKEDYSFLSLPTWDLTAVLTIAPIALVTVMEHIGDITTNGMVVGKDFFKEPGLHRTLLGDGLATAFAGLVGGPANTTYSENTGVLAATGNYNPKLLRGAAILAILLGLLGKFGAVLRTIPVPVKGGIELVLFGMIASVGIRTIAEAKVDLTKARNLTIMGAVLCAGIGIDSIGGIGLVIGGVSVKLSGLFIATIIGVVMNLVLPKHDTEKEN